MAFNRGQLFRVLLIALALGWLAVAAPRAEEADRIAEIQLELQSENAELRLQGVKELQSLSWGNDHPVYQDVLQLLEDPDGRVRAYAARLTYLHQEPERGKPVVLELFDDPDPKVRAAALYVAEHSWMQDKEFIQPLLKLVEDEDELNRWRALSCLNARKAETDEMVPLLARRASVDEYWAARREAYTMLARLAQQNKAAARALFEGVSDKQPDVVNYCASIMPGLGEAAAPAIPLLAAHLQNECFSCSYMGVSDALAELGNNDALRPIVERELVVYFASDDKYTIGSVCTIIEQFQPASLEVKAAVLKLLEHELHSMRYQGAMLLYNTYTDDPGTVGPLIGLLDDPDKYVRYHAARALGARGSRAEPAVPRLVDNLRNHFFNLVREASAEALGQIGLNTSEVQDALSAALADENDAVALQAIASMQDLGIQSSSARDKLAELAASDDAKIKARARKLIEMNGGGK